MADLTVDFKEEDRLSIIECECHEDFELEIDDCDPNHWPLKMRGTGIEDFFKGLTYRDIQEMHDKFTNHD